MLSPPPFRCPEALSNRDNIEDRSMHEKGQNSLAYGTADHSNRDRVGRVTQRISRYTARISLARSSHVERALKVC
jgi:hypothetical protein